MSKQLMCLNLDKVRTAILHTSPFEYLIVDDVLHSDCKAAISRDFPEITERGSHDLAKLTFGAGFQHLIDDLLGAEFQNVVAERFNVELSSFTKAVGIRAVSDPEDGTIHPDLPRKVITVLLYLNDTWTHESGRLRLLNSENLDDYCAEIPPTMGSLLIFKRCDHSWHGYKQYGGPRRNLQMNWNRVIDAKDALEMVRKRVIAARSPGDGGYKE